MVAVQSWVGPNTRVIVPDGERDLTVPLMELDTQDLERVIHTAEVILRERAL